MVKKKDNLADNVSLTAYRVLAILMMLKEAPHTEVEINEKFKNDQELPRGLSKDSIWLYINTLKAIGCDITRPSKKNDYKYTLLDHPFKLNLTDAEFKSLLAARKYVSNLSDWEISCNFEKFLSTLSEFLPEEDKQILIKTCKSKQREIDYTLKKDLIKEIEYYCSNNTPVLLEYDSPSGHKAFIKLLSDTIKYENDALYLWGYNYELEDYQYLRIDRIESVKALKNENIPEIKPPLEVKFKLYGIHSVSYNPEDDEEIIHRDENSIIVKAKIKNKFKLVQKMLSFGRDCEVIEPKELQQELLRNLKLMLKVYEKEEDL